MEPIGEFDALSIRRKQIDAIALQAGVSADCKLSGKCLSLKGYNIASDSEEHSTTASIPLC